MKLSEYIKNKNLPYAEVAELLGVDPQAIYYWISGERIPKPENMRKIFEITGGAVTANDFFNLPPGAG